MKKSSDVTAPTSANTRPPVVARLRAGGSGWHRTSLLVSLLPLVAFLLFVLVMRAGSPLNGPPPRNRGAFVSTPVSAQQAWQSAERITSTFTGQRAYLRATDQLRSFSPRTRRSSRYWEIISESGAQRFVFRISADDGRIVSASTRTRRRGGGNGSASADGRQKALSASEIEERAMTYLRALIVDGSSPFTTHAQTWFTLDRKQAGRRTWTFSFTVHEGKNERSARVVVDARTGAFVSTLTSPRRAPARVAARRF